MDKDKKISLNFRGKAMIAALNAGLIHQDKKGNLDARAFNRFWDEIEKIIYKSWAEKSGHGFHKLFWASEAGQQPGQQRNKDD